MKTSYNTNQNPRVIIIQKLYGKFLNDDAELTFPKHRFKKFIKDISLGVIERKDLIDETILEHLGGDINIKRTEKLLIIILQAGIYELLYRPQTSINIIINEYVGTAKIFVDDSQKKFLNALLDKISKKIRS